MVDHWQTGALEDAPKPLVSRFEELSPEDGRKQEPPLRSEIIACVARVYSKRREIARDRKLHGENVFQQVFDERRLTNQIFHRTLESSQQVVLLPQAEAHAPHHGPPLLVRGDASLESTVQGRVVRVGKRVALEVSQIGERVHVHLEPVIDGVIPADAPDVERGVALNPHDVVDANAFDVVSQNAGEGGWLDAEPVGRLRCCERREGDLRWQAVSRLPPHGAQNPLARGDQLSFTHRQRSVLRACLRILRRSGRFLHGRRHCVKRSSEHRRGCRSAAMDESPDSGDMVPLLERSRTPGTRNHFSSSESRQREAPTGRLLPRLEMGVEPIRKAGYVGRPVLPPVPLPFLHGQLRRNTGRLQSLHHHL